jgi:hypothetical protein
MYQIEFKGVGRDKRSWSETVKQLPTEPVIARLARKGGRLMSREIEAIFDEDLEHGLIVVGGFREAGAFRVTSKGK